MTEKSEKKDEQELNPEYCKLANQHVATYLSTMGNHTPEVNSDSVFLNTEEKPERHFPRLLAMVNNGVSGEKEYIGLAPGKFAADFFSRELPMYWREGAIKDQIKFSQTLIFQPSLGAKKISDVYCWLIQCIDRSSVSIEPHIAKWLMSLHSDLLTRPNCKIPIERFYGHSAQEIAEAILIEKTRLAAILRLLIAIYHSTRTFSKAFQKKYKDEKLVEKKPFYAVTTATGIVDLEKDYMLFSIGDSAAVAVDEYDIIDDSTTTCSAIGKKTSAIGSGFADEKRQEQFFIPHNSSRLVDGAMVEEKRIAVNFVRKDDLSGSDLAMILLTDGLMQTPNWLRTVTNSISRDIGNSRKAILGIYGRALKLDGEIKKAHPLYNPDDKTLVIVKRCAV